MLLLCFFGVVYGDTALACKLRLRLVHAVLLLQECPYACTNPLPSMYGEQRGKGQMCARSGSFAVCKFVCAGAVHVPHIMCWCTIWASKGAYALRRPRRAIHPLHLYARASVLRRSRTRPQTRVGPRVLREKHPVLLPRVGRHLEGSAAVICLRRLAAAGWRHCTSPSICMWLLDSHRKAGPERRRLSFE